MSKTFIRNLKPVITKQTIKRTNIRTCKRILRWQSIKMNPPQCPPLSAKVKGSFAYKTVKDRMPVILTQVIDYLCRDKTNLQETYGEESSEEIKAIIGKLSQLRSEMQTNKPLPMLESIAGDVDLWNDHYSKQEQPIRWFDSPWLFVECYMYRKIWETFQQSSKLKTLDPFHHKKKEAYFASIETIRLIGEFFLKSLDSRITADKDFFTDLMEVALWGNRNDLSISAGKTESHVPNIIEDLKELESHILVNDIEQVWKHLIVLKEHDDVGQISWIMDNAGLEIVGDFCLADFLISYGFCNQIRFHVKKMPWFVSDVTLSDFRWVLKHLDNDSGPALRKLAERWTGYLDSNKWTIVEDWFWTSPLPYKLMESHDHDLYRRLSSCKLLMFKGDLNYRKLGADLQWPTEVSFEEMLQGFQPAPLVVLRTLKAEIVSGIHPNQARQLSQRASNWLTSGEFAIVQFSGGV